MADSKVLFLNWEEHPLYVVSRFCHFLEREMYVDITLECEGRMLKAHRIVLAASSDLFEKILDNQDVISLVGVPFDVLYSVVEFIYYGQSRISGELLSSVLKLAKFLEVRGLASVNESSVHGALASTSVDTKKRSIESDQQPAKKQKLMTESEKIKIPVRIHFALENARGHVSAGDRNNEGTSKGQNLVETVQSRGENPIRYSTNQSLLGQKDQSMEMFIGSYGERRIGFLNNPSRNPEDIVLAPLERKAIINISKIKTYTRKMVPKHFSAP